MAKRKRRPTEAAPAVAVRAEGLSKSYGDLTALEPLDLCIDTGTVVTLAGHNGSGKSTLLQLIAGLLDPSEGSVDVFGHPAGSLPARAALSYIGDAPVLYDDLSVWEHLEYLARLNGVDDWEARGNELLDRFRLAERADDLPVQFSRGLRQKTALVVGLVRDAGVLLIDEPFVGLDRRGKDALLDLIRERRSGGATVVLATHDSEVLGIADRCVALHNGVVVHDGSSAPSTLESLAG